MLTYTKTVTFEVLTIADAIRAVDENHDQWAHVQKVRDRFPCKEDRAIHGVDNL